MSTGQSLKKVVGGSYSVQCGWPLRTTTETTIFGRLNMLPYDINWWWDWIDMWSTLGIQYKWDQEWALCR